ncbi:hypothetical protein EBU99_00915 [bacterium]|nr:hypothetical protein [bacterium]
MHKELRAGIAFSLIRLFAVGIIVLCQTAFADLHETQSFQPVQWESDFVADKNLSFTTMLVPERSQIVGLLSGPVRTAYGLQLGQRLRDHWMGRVSLFFGRNEAKTGNLLWSFLGSDLSHPLISDALSEWNFFRVLRPIGFFGLGFVSRWENTAFKYNLLPTARYELSEPIAYAGGMLQLQVAQEVILATEYRYLQSARASHNRGPTFAISLIWGSLEKM